MNSSPGHSSDSHKQSHRHECSPSTSDSSLSHTEQRHREKECYRAGEREKVERWNEKKPCSKTDGRPDDDDDDDNGAPEGVKIKVRTAGM